jgi:hypothetical protein
MVGNMLEQYYKNKGGLVITDKSEWHLQNSLDKFPGYYYFNTMLQLIARKQELQKIQLDYMEQGKSNLYEPSLIDTISQKESAFIGKAHNIYDTSQAG